METQRTLGQMPTRLRKLIGSVGVLAFLAGYVWLVATLYGYVPKGALFTLAYFAVAGFVWGVPLIPLIRWMNGAPRER